LPDPDEPLVHVYAEGASEEESYALEESITALVTGIIEGQDIEALEGITG
jgi:hypothetical protein